MSDRPSFETLVSVACHDLRTPLATVHGFARTLSRVDLEEPAVRYVAMIEQASGQIAELLDELSLVTRISQGRYEPRLEQVDSLRLAQEAAAELEEGSVELSGEGAPVRGRAGLGSARGPPAREGGAAPRGARHDPGRGARVRCSRSGH